MPVLNAMSLVSNEVTDLLNLNGLALKIERQQHRPVTDWTFVGDKDLFPMVASDIELSKDKWQPSMTKTIAAFRKRLGVTAKEVVTNAVWRTVGDTVLYSSVETDGAELVGFTYMAIVPDLHSSYYNVEYDLDDISSFHNGTLFQASAIKDDWVMATTDTIRNDVRDINFAIKRLIKLAA